MRAMLTGILLLLALCVGAFIALSTLLYLRQESFIFYPGPNDATLLSHWRAKRIKIPSGEHVLEGWWADNPTASTPAVILYFGGNAEDVLYTATTIDRIDASRMLVVNYRGYGCSRGRPGQAALFLDALAIYDYAVTEVGVPAEHVVVMGRSLGSGVATMLASKRPVRGAILVNPFDSLAAVAAHHYPLVPVRLLLRHPFPSSTFAKEASAPALFLAAEDDEIIPPVHAMRLHDAWAGPGKLRILGGVGHNDIEQHPDYYTLINEFLRSPPDSARTR